MTAKNTIGARAHLCPTRGRGDRRALLTDWVGCEVATPVGIGRLLAVDDLAAVVEMDACVPVAMPLSCVQSARLRVLLDDGR